MAFLWVWDLECTEIQGRLCSQHGCPFYPSLRSDRGQLKTTHISSQLGPRIWKLVPKTTVLGCPMVKPHYLMVIGLSHYRRVIDGQTDGRMNRHAKSCSSIAEREKNTVSQQRVQHQHNSKMGWRHACCDVCAIWYVVRFGVPLDTLQSLRRRLWVRRSNQQCHSTESTRSKANPTRLWSPKGKLKNVTKI